MTTVFGTLNQPGLSANGSAPPDTTGAIGPLSYIEFVNSLVGIYSRSTLGVLSTVDLDVFVGKSGDCVFDPQIEYDPVSQHFFYLTDVVVPDPITGKCTGAASLAFGWSKTSNPTAAAADWCPFTVSSDTGGAAPGSFLDDYPKLGHDDSHVIFGTNVFGNTTLDQNFKTARIWAYNKPASYSTCTAPTLTFAGDPNLVTPALHVTAGDPTVTPVPANTSDSSPTGFVVAADEPAVASRLGVYKVTGSPAIAVSAAGNITTPAFAIPGSVPQPSPNAFVLDSLDTRLTQAVAHADPDASGAEAFWTQHTVDGTGGRSVVRWYELLPGLCAAGSCPAGALRQSGTVSDPASFVFNGAISPATAGNKAVIHYDVGGTGQLVQIRARSRTATTPSGAMLAEKTLATSLAGDSDFTCSPGPCRWGDYAGASPDPSNPALVWGSNQFNGTAGDPAWRTQNFAIAADSTTAIPPVPVLTTSPPAPVAGVTTVTLDASASSDDGTIVDYRFDLNGDGTYETNTGASPTTTTVFKSKGTKTVGVRVTDDDGLSSTTTATVTVAPAAPSAALAVTPNPATVGARVSYSAAGSTDPDADGIVSYRFDLDGNGSFETYNGASPTVSQIAGSAGERTVKVLVTDGDGLTAQASTVMKVNPAPAIAARVQSFSATRRRFAVGAGTTAIVRRRAPPRGTTFKYSLSDPATVRIEIAQRTTGAKVGGRCLRRTAARAHRPTCTRFVVIGTLTRSNRPTGASALKFTGWVAGTKLSPGTYRATITAQHPAGPVSRPRSVSFTILKG